MRTLRNTVTTVATSLGVLALLAAPSIAGGNHGDGSVVSSQSASSGQWHGNEHIWLMNHTEWPWMIGLHWLYWPLMVIFLIAILVVSVRVATRECRSNADVTKFDTREPHRYGR